MVDKVRLLKPPRECMFMATAAQDKNAKGHERMNTSTTDRSEHGGECSRGWWWQQAQGQAQQGVVVAASAGVSTAGGGGDGTRCGSRCIAGGRERKGPWLS